MTVSADSAATRLQQAVLEMLEAEDGGSVVDREALLRKYHDVADELSQYFETVESLTREAKGPLSPARHESAVARVSDADPATADSGRFRLGPHLELFLPDFEDAEITNRGGMGLILRARQKSLNRIVALKFILLGRRASEADLRRFRTEAEVLARLSHPAIVAVYDAGESDGHPYLVMEFIEGRSLQTMIAESPLNSVPAAELVRSVTEAVAEAHRHDILHRDLKPSNILVDNNNRPRVTDFGLAKVLSEEDDLTTTGQIVGTPEYMAPEQARGERGIGPAADIYAIGAVLYAALTGRPPFRGPGRIETLRSVREREPPRPTLLNPRIPRDLETICMKCLRKEPRARYRSAIEVAEDLQRFLDRRPIHARRAGLLERSWRWTTANRMPAAIIFMVVMFTASGAAGLAIHSGMVAELNTELSSRNMRLQSLLETSDRLRMRGQATAQHAQQLSYASDMRVAVEAWHRQDTRQVADLLENHLPQLHQTDLRCFVWRYLSRVIPHADQMIGEFPEACYFVAFSPEGNRLAVCGADGHVRIFQHPTGELVADWDTGQRELNSVAFHPHETWLATAGDDGTVRLWTWPDGKERAVFPIFDNKPVYTVLFTQSGDRMVACGDDPGVQVWDLSTRSQIKVLDGHSGRVEALAISPDGRYLASAGRDHQAIIWQLDTLEPLRRYLGHAVPVTCVSFLEDSSHFVSGSTHGDVFVWEVDSGDVSAALNRPDGIQQVAVGPDGLMAITDRGGSLTFWRPLETAAALQTPAQPLAVWRIDKSRVYGAAFADDGESIVTASRAGNVVRWKIDNLQPVTRLGQRQQDAEVFYRATHATGSGEMLVCSPSGLLKWNPATQESVTLISGTNVFASCDVSADGQRIVAVESPETVHLRDQHGQLTSIRLGSPADAIEEIQFVPETTEVLVRRKSGELSTVDLQSGEQHVRFPKCSTFLVGESGRRVWVAERGTGNSVIVLSCPDWRQVGQIPGHRETIRAMAVSPDETFLVTSGNDRSLAVWDLHTGECVHRHEALAANGTGLAWSPDGRTIAACTDDGTVSLFQAETWRDLGLLQRPTPVPLFSVCFSNDGNFLICLDAFQQASAFDGRVPDSH